MTKKKTKRSNTKYPSLDKSTNLKLRRDYMDSEYYINGVTVKEEQVMRSLSEDEKAWLDKFYSEYYGASFPEGEEHLHKNLADDSVIEELVKDKNRLSQRMKKLGSAKKNADKYRALKEKYDEVSELINELCPKNKCVNDNNARNRCLSNIYKATNRIESWDDLNQNSVGDVDIDITYVVKNKKKPT